MSAGLAANVARAGIVPPGEALDCRTIVVSAVFPSAPPSSIVSLHPVLTSNSGAEQEGISLLYLPLLWIDRQYRIDWSKSLASSVAANADGTRFTVTLRPWHWSDGMPVTAADVLYTWDLIQALGPAFTGWGVGGVPQLIRSVTAPDAKTVVFDLKQAANPDWFEKVGIDAFTPLPKQAWSRYSLAQQQSRQSDPAFYSVVDGPFRLRTLDLSRDAVFVPNRRYDGHHPTYGRLVLDFLEGANPLERLRSGQLDAINFPYSVWNAVGRLRDVRRVDPGPDGALGSIVLNLRNSHRTILQRVAVRQAIARAIDQQRMIDTVWHGQGLRQEGFVATEDAALLPPELRGGGGPMSYDPAAAAALLDRNGFRPGPDGIRVAPEGERLAFTLLISPDSGAVPMSQLMQADLRRVGIELDIKQVEFNQLLARMLGPHDGWDAVILAWGSGNYPDGTQWFSAKSTGNYGGYADPMMDRLLADATTKAGSGPLFALERYVVEQQPMIFLPNGKPSVLARDTIGGVEKVSGPSGELSAEFLTTRSPPVRCEPPGA